MFRDQVICPVIPAGTLYAGNDRIRILIEITDAHVYVIAGIFTDRRDGRMHGSLCCPDIVIDE